MSYNLRNELEEFNAKVHLTLIKVLKTQNRSAINTTISLDACNLTTNPEIVKGKDERFSTIINYDTVS